MFVLAHLAAGYVAGRLWNLVARRHQVNVFVAMFGGILPDIIDKPLSLLPMWVGGRTVAHTLLFLVVLAALTKTHRWFLPLAIGVATHLALDDPTTYLSTLVWPLLGPEFTPDEDLSMAAIEHHIMKTRTLVAELIGGAIVVVVASLRAWNRMGRSESSVQLGRIVAFGSTQEGPITTDQDD